MTNPARIVHPEWGRKKFHILNPNDELHTWCGLRTFVDSWTIRFDEGDEYAEALGSEMCKTCKRRHENHGNLG